MHKMTTGGGKAMHGVICRERKKSRSEKKKSRRVEKS